MRMKLPTISTSAEGLWKTEQVRLYLGCSKRMVQKLVQTRQLPARRLGVEYRFEPGEVEAFRRNLPVVGVPIDRRRLRMVTAQDSRRSGGDPPVRSGRGPGLTGLCLVGLGVLLGGLLLAAPAAWAEMYGEGFGTLSQAVVTHGSARDPYGPVTQETAPAAGYGLRIGGFKTGGYLGAEVEAMHTNAPLKADKVCTYPTPYCQMVPGRRLTINSLGINGLVRYPHNTFEPFLGVGLAYLVANLGPDVCGNGYPTCGPLQVSYSDFAQRAATVGYTLKAGMLWKATAHWGLTLTYEVQKARFQFSGVIPAPGNAIGGFGETLDAGWQTVQLGLRYRFDLD